MRKKPERDLLPWIWIVFGIIANLVLHMITGCATVDQTPPGSVPLEFTTRASMPFVVEGKTYVGTAVLPRQSRTVIEFKIPSNTLKLMISSCHREEFNGLPQGDSFKWIYVPVMYIENLDSCIVTAFAITKTGQQSKAMIDFRTGEALKADVACNGNGGTGLWSKEVGCYICQSRDGLIQGVDFSEDVVSIKSDNCSEMRKGFGSNSFRYTTTKGLCIYTFFNKSKEIFRLTTYGYSSIDDPILVK